MSSGILHGRVALVTGGAARIGAEICQSLASEGAIVAVHYHRSLAAAEDLIEEIGRMIGYDTIPAISEISSHRLGMSTETQVTEERITDLFE